MAIRWRDNRQIRRSPKERKPQVLRQPTEFFLHLRIAGRPIGRRSIVDEEQAVTLADHAIKRSVCFAACRQDRNPRPVGASPTDVADGAVEVDRKPSLAGPRPAEFREEAFDLYLESRLERDCGSCVVGDLRPERQRGNGRDAT
jgi:hypothetical protein